MDGWQLVTLVCISIWYYAKWRFPIRIVHSTLLYGVWAVDCGAFTQSPPHSRASAGVVFFVCVKCYIVFLEKKTTKKMSCFYNFKISSWIVRFGSIFFLNNRHWTQHGRGRIEKVTFYFIKYVSTCVYDRLCIRAQLSFTPGFATTAFQLKEINWFPSLFPVEYSTTIIIIISFSTYWFRNARRLIRGCPHKYCQLFWFDLTPRNALFLHVQHNDLRSN